MSRAPDSIRKVSLSVMLRMTRMDVCCGPPQG
jgi:hypothetical protein